MRIIKRGAYTFFNNITTFGDKPDCQPKYADVPDSSGILESVINIFKLWQLVTREKMYGLM